MAAKKKDTLNEVVSKETNDLDKVKGFWDKYKKIITITGSVLVLGVGGWFIYKKFYKEPRELKANELILPAEDLFFAMAESFFNADSSKIVLEGGQIGGEKITGLKKIMKDYAGTAAANRAKYMAGAISLHTQKFDDAIKYLNEFNSNGALQIETKRLIMIGDAYAEKKQKDQAYDYYKKATLVNEKDEVMTADAVYRLARYAEYLGKTQEAIDGYKKIKNSYPRFSDVQNGEIEKRLARLGILD